MAWVQINLDLPYLNVCQGTIVNFDCCENSWTNRQNDEANIAFIAQYLTGDFAKDNDLFPTQETEIYRNGEYFITIKGDGTSASTASQGWQIRFKKDNGDTHLAWQSGGNGRYISYFKWALAINEEEQKGAFVFGRYSHDNYSSSVGRSNSNEDSSNTAINLYNWLVGAIPPAYNWQSVPAISGKNGILSLTQILNINDGEPVQDITNKGNLDFSKKTKVNTLVNSVYEPTYKEDQTKASVEYEIPEAEYQYTKLVYKKKKIPKSPSDGTAIDIGADDTEAFVSGLEENTTYYFVVFTNRTKSNAYKFKTGKNEAPDGIFKMRITTAQGVKDSDFKEVIEVTRV